MALTVLIVGVVTTLAVLVGYAWGRRVASASPVTAALPLVAAPPVAAEAVDPGQLKEEFLTTVSHELRTPLNAILGWIELLRSGATSPAEIPRGLEVIERNARRQLALIEELLAAASPEHDPASWERVDLRELMAALIDGLLDAAAASSIVIEHDAGLTAAAPAADAGPVWVLGDRAGLRLAFRHLVENAIKFTPAGGRVRAGLGRAGGAAVVEISDSGPGVDAAASRRIFEPFSQQDGSRARKHGGLGLGLTIARRVIEAHGGTIDVGSGGEGRGATFLVTLPLSVPS